MTRQWRLLGLCLIAVGGGTALACITPETTAATSTTLLSSPCLQQSSSNIYVPNVSSGSSNRIGIPAGKTADFRTKPLVAIPPTYPLNVKEDGGFRANGCLTGLMVTGRQSTTLSWNQMHDIGGAGIRGELSGTPAIIDRVHIYNVEDAIRFQPERTTGNNNNQRWLVRGAYVVYSRDDAIENDGCLGGTLKDSLIDGTYAFISARAQPSGNTCPSGWQDNTIVIKNVLVRIECQRHESRQTSGCPSGFGTGQLFKWTNSTPLPVNVQDSIFLLPAKPFCYRPPGTYKNVTIVWRGSGSYPCNEPPGVTVTTDIALWNQARDAWLQRHGCERGPHGAGNPGSCPFTQR